MPITKFTHAEWDVLVAAIAYYGTVIDDRDEHQALTNDELHRRLNSALRKAHRLAPEGA